MYEQNDDLMWPLYPQFEQPLVPADVDPAELVQAGFQMDDMDVQIQTLGDTITTTVPATGAPPMYHNSNQPQLVNYGYAHTTHAPAPSSYQPTAAEYIGTVYHPTPYDYDYNYSYCHPIPAEFDPNSHILDLSNHNAHAHQPASDAPASDSIILDLSHRAHANVPTALPPEDVQQSPHSTTLDLDSGFSMIVPLEETGGEFVQEVDVETDSNGQGRSPFKIATESICERVKRRKGCVYARKSRPNNLFHPDRDPVTNTLNPNDMKVESAESEVEHQRKIAQVLNKNKKFHTKLSASAAAPKFRPKKQKKHNPKPKSNHKKCGICGFAFADELTLRRHQIIIHAVKFSIYQQRADAGPIRPTTGANQVKVQCGICKKFLNKPSMPKHLEGIHKMGGGDVKLAMGNTMKFGSRPGRVIKKRLGRPPKLKVQNANVNVAGKVKGLKIKTVPAPSRSRAKSKSRLAQTSSKGQSQVKILKAPQKFMHFVNISRQPRILLTRMTDKELRKYRANVKGQHAAAVSPLDKSTTEDTMLDELSGRHCTICRKLFRSDHGLAVHLGRNHKNISRGQIRIPGIDRRYKAHRNGLGLGLGLPKVKCSTLRNRYTFQEHQQKMKSRKTYVDPDSGRIGSTEPGSLSPERGSRKYALRPRAEAKWWETSRRKHRNYATRSSKISKPNQLSTDSKHNPIKPDSSSIRLVKLKPGLGNLLILQPKIALQRLSNAAITEIQARSVVAAPSNQNSSTGTQISQGSRAPSKCRICNFVLHNSGNLRRHHWLVHNIKPVLGRLFSPNRRAKRVPCRICGLSLSNPPNLRRHQRLIHKIQRPGMVFSPNRTAKRVHCGICGLSLSCRPNLARHVWLKHKLKPTDRATFLMALKQTRVVKVKCELCGKKVDKSHIQKHLKASHKLSNSSIITDRDQVDKTNGPSTSTSMDSAASTNLLSVPPVEVEGAEPQDPRILRHAKCGICGLTLFDLSNLRRHQVAVHKFIPPPKKLISPSRRRHLLAHRVKCGICGSTLFDLSNLRRHQLAVHKFIPPPKKLISSGPNRVKCGICGLTLSDPSNLRRHQREIHTVNVIRPKRLISPSRRRRHRYMANHVKCGICGMILSEHWSLRRHLLTVHKLNPTDLADHVPNFKKYEVKGPKKKSSDLDWVPPKGLFLEVRKMDPDAYLEMGMEVGPPHLEHQTTQLDMEMQDGRDESDQTLVKCEREPEPEQDPDTDPVKSKRGNLRISRCSRSRKWKRDLDNLDNIESESDKMSTGGSNMDVGMDQDQDLESRVVVGRVQESMELKLALEMQQEEERASASSSHAAAAANNDAAADNVKVKTHSDLSTDRLSISKKKPKRRVHWLKRKLQSDREIKRIYMKLLTEKCQVRLVDIGHMTNGPTNSSIKIPESLAPSQCTKNVVTEEATATAAANQQDLIDDDISKVPDKENEENEAVHVDVDMETSSLSLSCPDLVTLHEPNDLDMTLNDEEIDCEMPVLPVEVDLDPHRHRHLADKSEEILSSPVNGGDGEPEPCDEVPEEPCTPKLDLNLDAGIPDEGQGAKSAKRGHRVKKFSLAVEDVGLRLTKCPICDDMVQYQSLTAHKNSHEIECHICGKAVPILEIGLHGRTHVASLTCEVCNYKANQKSRSWEHMNIHFGVKPLICLTCGSSFAQANALSTHIMLQHTNITNHACRFCDSKFALSYQKARHELTHKGTTCPICDGQFSTKADLLVHMKGNHKLA